MSLRNRTLRAIRRRGPLLAAKRVVDRLAYDLRLPRADHQIVTGMPLFTPASAGSWSARAKLTLLAANQTFPLLARLVGELDRERLLEITPIDELYRDPASLDAMARIKVLFDRYGSDKASMHDYHKLYGPLLKEVTAVATVLEIGLGTDNVDVVSNMGHAGSPGASLRAFRDFLPNARIFGADIDRSILFEEERIRTFYVDQTDLSSFETLDRACGGEFDLIIDDGLHAPNANMAVLIFALPRLKRGGTFVVEDIATAALPVWQVVAALLPPQFRSRLVAASRGNLFAVERLATDGSGTR